VTGATQAAEINAFISTALKTVTDELLPPLERANGHTIRASYAPSGALIPRFDGGEPVDIFLTDSAVIDILIKQGKVFPGVPTRNIIAGRAPLSGSPRPIS
jgi:ABC-type molybdate transport system substrate-binding protein